MRTTTEIAIFIGFVSLILLVFIGGVLLFIIRYRKRKMQYEKEKLILNDVHHRELLQAQLQIQAQTMQDIGREIHDNVGQRLTLASIYANQLLATNSNKDAAEQIATIGSIINNSLAELRSLSKSLVNNDADAKELVATLRDECQKVAALKTCTLNCQIPDLQFGLSATIKNFIVRIAQEALQNSLKHAACKTIELKLEFQEEQGLSLEISDDGRGFDKDVRSAGIGLENMRERAALIGGIFSIENNSPAGTTVKLFVSIEKLQAV